MFRVLARTITAAAVVLALVLSTDPGVVEVDTVKCRTTRFKDKSATPATGHREVLPLVCGGNPGRLFGARTSMPATSGRLPLSSHGRPGTSSATGLARARAWEAHYTARYRKAYGKCPPGMPRCL